VRPGVAFLSLTPARAVTSSAYFAQAAQALPARRVATAEDIAEVVAMAAANSNLTGTVIEADGGARLVSLA